MITFELISVGVIGGVIGSLISSIVYLIIHFYLKRSKRGMKREKLEKIASEALTNLFKKLHDSYSLNKS